MTPTAEATQALAQVAAGVALTKLQLVIAAGVGLVGAPMIQRGLEKFLMQKEWMPQALKYMAPTLASFTVAALAAYGSGVPLEAAITGAITATLGAHAIHKSAALNGKPLEPTQPTQPPSEPPANG